MIQTGTKISEVNPLRSIDYNPAGRTALFDAIHLGIELAEEIKRSDERVTCILITDGEDNASKQNVSCKTTKKLVKKYDIKADWSFTYIGKPTEYWHRTKPVSKVSYESNVPRFQRYNSSVALRRMRSAALSAVASNGSQTSLVCQWLVPTPRCHYHPSVIVPSLAATLVPFHLSFDTLDLHWHELTFVVKPLFIVVTQVNKNVIIFGSHSNWSLSLSLS